MTFRAVNIVDGVTVDASGDFTLRRQLVQSIESVGERQDLRWARVTVATPVLWDGEVTTWGELSQNERASVQMTERGCLVGSNPF